MAASKLQAFWNHPAGPRTKNPLYLTDGGVWFRRFGLDFLKISPLFWFNGTIHFWAPTFKWGLSIANVADFSKPPETLSYPMQFVVACSGLIWGRYGTVIKPRNWNLVSVNLAMSGTGFYQLSRKIRHDYHSKTEAEIITE